VRSGPVFSGALDREERLDENLRTGWNKLVDHGLHRGHVA
jgi:hypothetical protein